VAPSGGRGADSLNSLSKEIASDTFQRVQNALLLAQAPGGLVRCNLATLLDN